MFSEMKTAIKYIIFNFMNIFIKPSKDIEPKSLLLIRLDAIGDYVLFRNFIEVLKKSEKYKEYKITLLGNIAWKDLSEELDREFVDEFIWLDKNRFKKDPVYRYKKLKEITEKGYEVVLSPVYSREFFYTDTIVKLVHANEKIGSVGDLSNITKWLKKKSDKYYSKLIDARSEIMFEFYRNKEFFEKLLNQKIDLHKPHIDIKKIKQKNISFELPQRYAILFIGAGANFRKWNVGNFAKVGMWLKRKYGYEIVLCGGNSDRHDALKFRKYYVGEYLDLVGKTSLVELLYVIYNADLMISNETSAPHLAVALGNPKVFVISNGNHYGRFVPYPKDITENYYVIYHPEIEKDLDNYKKLSNSYGYRSNLDINEISVESVIEKIEKVLK